jgi:hypothetical protein
VVSKLYRLIFLLICLQLYRRASKKYAAVDAANLTSEALT